MHKGVIKCSDCGTNLATLPSVNHIVKMQYDLFGYNCLECGRSYQGGNYCIFCSKREVKNGQSSI